MDVGQRVYFGVLRPTVWLQLREQRKIEQDSNPHYLKGPAKSKVGEGRFGGIFSEIPVFTGFYVGLMI